MSLSHTVHGQTMLVQYARHEHEYEHEKNNERVNLPLLYNQDWKFDFYVFHSKQFLEQFFFK